MEFFQPCEKVLDKWFDEGLAFFHSFFSRKIGQAIIGLIDLRNSLKCLIRNRPFTGLRASSFHCF